jgi:phage-related tail fiber protein
MQDPAYRGIDGNATLIWIEFLIQDYGYSDLIMYDTGMADSFANPTVHTTTNGWFDNRITGDSDGSGIVTIADMGEVSDRWTSPPGVKPYARFVDWDNNGVISISDMGIVSDNWGRFVP